MPKKVISVAKKILKTTSILYIATKRFIFDDVQYITNVVKEMLKMHKKQMEIKEAAEKSDANHLLQLESEKINQVNLKQQNMDIFELLRQAEENETSF